MLPVKMAVATDAADAADAKAAEASRSPVDVDRNAATSSPGKTSGQSEANGSEDAQGRADAANSANPSRSTEVTGATADTKHAETNGALETRRRPESGSSTDTRRHAETGSSADPKRHTDRANSADAKRHTETGSSADTKRHAPAGHKHSSDSSNSLDPKRSADTKVRAEATNSADAIRTSSRSGANSKGSSGADSAAAAKDTSNAAEPAKQPAESLTPLPAAKTPGGEFMPANFIPGYTIHATIGESEKAAVYVATSAALNENVALKVSKTLRDEAAGRQFLEREYTAIVAIRDPSVVQIYDYGVHAGYEYLVMEYLPRGDLKARMQQALTEQEALRYVAQIAAALQVVHHAGLLHRDLKPPNVMLRENGDVALIDFGLARALDGSSASTRTGVLRGSPYYMSPEQAMGEILDARSDFYSLGIMFYEMLTGKKPYTGGSAMDVLQQHVNAPLPMLPKALAHHEPLLLKLMAKSREDRFANAEDILVAIAAKREVERATARASVQVESSAA